MATHNQYGNDDRDVPDGILDSEYPNRDSEAMHIKLDELIRAIDGAHKCSSKSGKLGRKGVGPNSS
jgi:hypothetical protein